MYVRLILALVAILALTACGADDAALPTLAPTVASDDAGDAADSTDTEAEVAPTTAPETNTESETTNTLDDSFTATVTGSVEGNMGRMIGVDICNRGFTDVSYTNTFNVAEGDAEGSVRMSFPQDQATGTFTYDPDAIESFRLLSVNVDNPNSDDPMAGYTQPQDWTLELTRVATAPGEAYSGTFTITLGQFSSTGEADPNDTVTVTGAFTYVMDELCPDA
jgi:hypothetical protein